MIVNHVLNLGNKNMLKINDSLRILTHLFLFIVAAADVGICAGREGKHQSED